MSHPHRLQWKRWRVHPITNTVIKMADHPDGIYHYTFVNISGGVTGRMRWAK